MVISSSRAEGLNPPFYHKPLYGQLSFISFSKSPIFDKSYLKILPQDTG